MPRKTKKTVAKTVADPMFTVEAVQHVRLTLTKAGYSSFGPGSYDVVKTLTSAQAVALAEALALAALQVRP